MRTHPECAKRCFNLSILGEVLFVPNCLHSPPQPTTLVHFQLIEPTLDILVTHYQSCNQPCIATSRKRTQVLVNTHEDHLQNQGEFNTGMNGKDNWSFTHARLHHPLMQTSGKKPEHRTVQDGFIQRNRWKSNAFTHPFIPRPLQDRSFVPRRHHATEERNAIDTHLSFNRNHVCFGHGMRFAMGGELRTRHVTLSRLTSSYCHLDCFISLLPVQLARRNVQVQYHPPVCGCWVEYRHANHILKPHPLAFDLAHLHETT